MKDIFTVLTMININYNSIFSELKAEFKYLLKNKYFYISLAILILGISLNFISQSYLYSYKAEGKNLPALSDLVLDNIPYLNVSFLYDWFALFSGIVFIIFVIHKKQYKKIPLYLLMWGIFNFLRGTFIVLTPLGHPPNFNGTDSQFHGFSRYELGVYPSGHTGAAFMYFLFSKGIYRWIIFAFCSVIISSLFLSRGHYSIDVLSGIIFSYAIYCFGEKYLTKFKGE